MVNSIGVIYGNGSCIDNSTTDAPRFCAPQHLRLLVRLSLLYRLPNVSPWKAPGISQGGKYYYRSLVVLVVIVIALVLGYFCWYKKR